MNGVEAWVYAFHGDFIGYNRLKEHELAKYDLVIANSNTTFIPRLVRLAAHRPAHLRWVTLIEGDALDYVKPLPSVLDIFRVSDLVNCINRPALALFQALADRVIPEKRAHVAMLGIPYPIDGVRQYAVAPEQRFEALVREMMICPFLGHRWNDWLVARAVVERYGQSSLRYYGYVRPLSRSLKNWRELWRARSLDKMHAIRHARALYNDAILDIRLASGLEDFFPMNAGAFCWLNLDERYTWARYVLDAAALGIPIITTASTGHGEALFPATTLRDELQLSEAVELVVRLLDDRSFYCEVSKQATGYLEQFAPAVMCEKLVSALNQISATKIYESNSSD
jgi:SAM-dependent methyltransferase